MFNIREMKDITDAIIINGNENTQIRQFSISKENYYKNDFYIPVFWREDRQKYIMDAVKAGAIGYIISSHYEEKDEIIKESISINPEIIILQVEDVTEAIYKMAEFKRCENIDMQVIAVTGSVGKTSTSEMIASILREEKKVLSDNGNNNTKPLMSWLMLNMEDYEIAVFEAGIGRKNVMEAISKHLMPSIVVINNIGTAHLGNLDNKETVLEEKLKLTTYMKDDKIVFLNDDDSMLKTVKLDDTYTIKKYSLNETKNIKQNIDFIEFETNVYNEPTKFHLKTYGEHNVSNAICAIRIAETLNIKKENIENGIRNYVSVDRRFKVIRKNKHIIIDDTYNASVDSMRAGLISANQIRDCKRRIAILGEMLELGEHAKDLHSQVGEIFKDVEFDILITQGDSTKYICEVAKKYMPNKTIINYECQEELIKYILEEVKEEDLIYLKASNKLGFDNIVKKLVEKCEKNERN